MAEKVRATKSSGKFLGSHVWLLIQGRYEKGESVRGLAREYSINPATICNRAKKYGWLGHGQLKEEAIQKARDGIKEEFSSTYKEMAKLALGNHYKLFRYIQQLGLRLLQDVDANSKLDEGKKKAINREIYQLNVLSQTIKSAVDGERLTLGMDSMKFADDKDGFTKFTDAIADMRKKKELPETVGEVEETEDDLMLDGVSQELDEEVADEEIVGEG